MATWIVHLRLAENLLSLIEDLDIDSFVVGNIAPDSGIPDEKWETFTPPVEVTHFYASDDAAWPVADLVFYRRYLVPHDRADAARVSFLLGYFFHLVTDNLWYLQIVQPTQERFAAEFEADPGFDWEVKRDWYGLDFAHVRSHPDSIFWRTFLHCTYTQDYLDFMPPEAVQQRIEYIQAFYQRTDEDVEKRYGERPDIYLSVVRMDSFVEEATQRLHGIYQRLWAGEAGVADLTSALEIAVND
jgi:hypothetical protein